MIRYQDLKHKTSNKLYQPEKQNVFTKILIRTTLLLSRNTTAFKLSFLHRSLNFIRVIGLYVIKNNAYLNDPKWLERDDANKPGRIEASLIELLYNFDMLINQNGKPTFNKKYIGIAENEKLSELFHADQIIRESSFRSKEQQIIHDFLFVNDLVIKYRNPTYHFKYVKKNAKTWGYLVENRMLDYEVRLCETLLQLAKLQIPHKIKSPFDEGYYTESGRNAFNNFTRPRFLECFSTLTKGKDSPNILDIGCGYGNYIAVLHEHFPNATVTGIEINPEIFASTRKTFEQTKHISIINDDFFQYQADQKFDVVLLNYVLFYFNRANKQKLLDKAKSILTDDGSILICQYFSRIEDLKKELAARQHDLSTIKKIEMYYSNKILYANTLWNDTVDTFSESAKWDEFLNIIDDAGLQIASLTNADKFYYSLFIELKVVSNS